jgi:hypothetical protein
VLSKMTKSEIEACKLNTIDDLDASLRDALLSYGEPRAAVLPDGPLTIPFVEGTA